MSQIYNFIKSLIISNRRIIIVLLHLIFAVLSSYLAFLIRFDFAVSKEAFSKFVDYLPLFSSYILLLLAIRLFFFLLFGLHKDLWRYSSIRDLVRVIASVSFGSITFFIAVRYLIGDLIYPRAIYAIDWLLLIMISGGSRLFLRVFREYMQHGISLGKKVLIIGAGDAGEMIVRDMVNNPKYAYKPVGFIDDNLYKKGLCIHGVPILGGIKEIDGVIKKYAPDEILIAMPSAANRTNKRVYDICKKFSLPIKTLPGLYEIIDGTVTVSQIKPLSLEDLLEREPVRTDIDSVRGFIEGKSVLVTGAGGSIGSELCRQITAYKPAVLILFDRYENGLFYIDRELRTKGSASKEAQGSQIVTIVGDVCDAATVNHLFSKQRPHLVFHAAAHKHVPLMEGCPLEAVKNNVFGTRNILNAAARHNVQNFIMISTDKAVNPTSVMGVSKRIAEYLTMNMNKRPVFKATTVRFGNVLGSNGSVVKTFKEQLQHGGPLTITDPEIKRYFMLIPEAVQLVLTAASAGSGGDIFVLDMGEQIRIVDLAENLVSLSGFVPYEDIKFEFTGLRPGEKMYEELFDESETVMSTFHEKLQIATPNNVPSMEELTRHLSNLEHIISNNSVDDLIPELQKIVPNFRQTHQ